MCWQSVCVGPGKAVRVSYSPSPPTVQGIPFPRTTCLTEVNHPANTMHLPCSGLTTPSRCIHFSWKLAAGSTGRGEKESGSSIPLFPSLCLFPQSLMFINGLQNICIFRKSISLVRVFFFQMCWHLPRGYTTEESVSPSLSHCYLLIDP